MYHSAVALLLLLLAPRFVCAQPLVDYEHDPIRYSGGKPANAITRLQARLDDGTTTLAFDEKHGFLAGLLHELSLPVSSQVLPFAMLSRQADRISPATPRAIYFNDEIYLGYVQGGLIEIATADPGLGTVFYTLDQKASPKPRFAHQINSCLNCHGGSRTRGVPGLLVRSVFADQEGHQVLRAGSFRTDHSSPLSERWGGWYVTGTSGPQAHLGNYVLTTPRKPKEIDNRAGQNVTDLSGRFDVTNYLSPHSDLVALMVLEHQIDAHNYLVRANFETRLALHAAAHGGATKEATQKRIEEAGELLVRHLLFCGEAGLSAPVRGTSKFATEFAARGPRDAKGRSLRDFDLTRRLFKHPCSYLIYSPLFDALPREVLDVVRRRLLDVLTTDDPGGDFAHLSAADRRAIHEILRDTKPGVFKASDGSRGPNRRER